MLKNRMLSPKIRTRQGYLLKTLLFTAWEVIANAITLKGTQIFKKEENCLFSPHRWPDCVCRESEEIYKNTLRTKNWVFSKVIGYKINIEQSVVFLYMRDKKNNISKSFQNYETFRDNFNKTNTRSAYWKQLKIIEKISISLGKWRERDHDFGLETHYY